MLYPYLWWSCFNYSLTMLPLSFPLFCLCQLCRSQDVVFNIVRGCENESLSDWIQWIGEKWKLWRGESLSTLAWDNRCKFGVLWFSTRERPKEGTECLCLIWIYKCSSIFSLNLLTGRPGCLVNRKTSIGLLSWVTLAGFLWSNTRPPGFPPGFPSLRSLGPESTFTVMRP